MVQSDCFGRTLAVVLLCSSLSFAQEDKSEEARHAEESREIFQAVHCSQADQAAVEAFAGCWKLGAVWGAPLEANLKLGMRMSEKRAQLLLESHSAHQSADSGNPRYCRFLGRPTVAPYPEADFSPQGTYVYLMLDITPEQAGQAAGVYYDSHERELCWEEYRQSFVEFLKKGGKYIRTLINMGPTNVWWDDDHEEDFWALPSSCDGWEKIEEILKDKWRTESENE